MQRVARVRLEQLSLVCRGPVKIFWPHTVFIQPWSTTQYLVSSYVASGRVPSIVMGVSVCVSVRPRSHISKTTWPNFTKFSATLPTAVARFSSGGFPIRYVLPVLWMTSCFHIMGP